MSASLYRERHHLSRAQHIKRLSVACGIGSDPLSTSVGLPAVYCKVQTILRPDSCQCVTHKIIQAAEIDQDQIKTSLPLNTINDTMGSWKHLLGTARNASRDFLSQSTPNISFALVSEAMGLDAEVLRIVLAKAHNPLLWNLVYPEVHNHDLMNAFVRQQSMLVLKKYAINFTSEDRLQTTRLSGKSMQSLGLPTSVNMLSRMPQDIMATAVSTMPFRTTNISLLSGASLPWR